MAMADPQQAKQIEVEPEDAPSAQFLPGAAGNAPSATAAAAPLADLPAIQRQQQYHINSSIMRTHGSSQPARESCCGKVP